jgi:hypothetical protein
MQPDVLRSFAELLHYALMLQRSELLCVCVAYQLMMNTVYVSQNNCGLHMNFPNTNTRRGATRNITTVVTY